MADLKPVDFDPFAKTTSDSSGAAKPVDFDPFAKRAAPVKEEPVYDPMGVATGYKQPSLSGPSKEVREFEQKEGPFGYAKEYAKGTAGFFAGLPGEVVNLPGTVVNLGQSAASKLLGDGQPYDPLIPRVPYGVPEMTERMFGKPTSNIAAGIRGTGEVLGIPSPFGAYAALRPGASKLFAGPLARTIEDVGVAGERIAEKGKKALSAEEATAAERLKRYSYQPTETDKIETLARGESKISSPDTIQMFEAGNDAESIARKLAETKGAAAEKLQETVGGGAFNRYKDIASEKQKAQPFGTAAEGKSLQNQLETIISGGEGSLRTYGQKAIDITKDIYKEIFGRRVSDISPKEIEAVASRLPQSFSKSARETQAKQILLEKESRRPVDYKIVDDLLRELRQIEQSKTPEAATAISRERYASAGDLVENALESWVGKDVYPRGIYAEASKDKNAWATRLGEVLRAKSEIPYTERAAEYQKPEVLGTLFESRSSTNFTKELLGEAETNALAERYAINELRGKKAADVEKWMQDSGNAFIYEVPGLSDKLKSYTTSIARREQESVALEALRKEAAGVPKAAEKTRDVIEKGVRGLKEGLDDPTKLSDKWSKIRETLEGTNLYTVQELDRIGEDVAMINRMADKKEKIDALTAAGTKILLKAAGLGTAGTVIGKPVYDLMFKDR